MLLCMLQVILQTIMVCNVWTDVGEVFKQLLLAVCDTGLQINYHLWWTSLFVLLNE